MPNPKNPFGQRLINAASVQEIVRVEQEHGKHQLFTTLDSLLTKQMVLGLQGYKVVQIEKAELKEDKIRFLHITGPEQEFLFTTYGLQNQQSRGAWYLPDKVKIQTGFLNLSAYFLEFHYLAGGVAYEENTEVMVVNSAEGLLIWSVLEPLFSGILLPLELRGRLSGSKTPEYMREAWKRLDHLLQTLGFSLQEELAPFWNGRDWHNLGTPGQLEAKRKLLTAIAHQVRPEMFPLYRNYRVRQLVDQYYSKAKNKGVAKRKQVVTKNLEGTLSGFFGGNWLEFLNYIEEIPHPDEEIPTSLPEIRLYTGGASKAIDVAAELGLSVKDIQLITGSYWQKDSGISPIEERVTLFKEYWVKFEHLHKIQKPGMPSLWGLVEDSPWLYLESGNDIYNPGLYRQLLPREMISTIEKLWGSAMLPGYPEKIVTEPFPHYIMAETWGPALKFWHGCALTAWFISEGPSSRTDMVGMEDYYRREITALKELGTPLDPELFRELIKAEKMLGPELPSETGKRIENTSLFNITFTSYHGNRRTGFELLRDIISRYRNNWTAQYLDTYLRNRWEIELKEAARKYQQVLHDRAKPPTLKQFAKTAEYCTNHWLGGNISQFYSAIGEKCPAESIDSRLLKVAPLDFATLVFSTLRNLTKPSVKNGIEGSTPGVEDNRNILKLAELSLRYLQLKEASGKIPTLKEVGTGKFEWYISDLDSDVSRAWEKYVKIVESVLTKVARI